MTRQIALLISIFVVTALAYDNEYESYKIQYGKQYRSAREAEARKSTFLKNLKTIHDNHEMYERGLVKHFLGVTEFADKNQDEFTNSMATGVKLDESLDGINEVSVIGGLSDLPASFDWNAQGKVTPAKQQGACGSCWAFSTMGVLESQALINGLGTMDLSESQLVYCFDKACDGADPRSAFLYLEKGNGACSESSYPYDLMTSTWGVPGECHECDAKLKVYRLGQLTGPIQDDDLKNFIMTRGPVVVTLESHGFPGTGTYQGGVIEYKAQGKNSSYTYKDKEALKLHAVIAVGWDQDGDGQDYWIIKNSWGESWGNKGFGKVGMGSERDCGINSYNAAYAPVVPGKTDTTSCRAHSETCDSIEKPNCCNGIDMQPTLSGDILCLCD